jgi:hypothetical protein
MTPECHCIQNEVIHNILLITKEEQPTGTALPLNNAPMNQKIAAMLYQAQCCNLNLYNFFQFAFFVFN